MATFEETVEKLATTVDKLAESTEKSGDDGVAASAAKEVKMEQAAAQKEQLGYLKQIAAALAGGETTKAGKEGAKAGGILAGLGSVMGKMGVGVGAGAAGIGALFAGGGYLLKQISEFDAKKVKNNILELLSIGAAAGGSWEFFKKGGAFGLSMLGLGIGLLAFSVGAGVSALTEGVISYFGQSDWATTIKKNVTTLLSISKLEGFKPGKGWEFTKTMAFLAVGMAIFGIGKSVNAAADLAVTGTEALGKHFNTFKTKDWAKTMYDNVKTLISITKLDKFNLKTGADFALTMGLLGFGMLIFGLGKSANAVGDITVTASEKLGEHFNTFKKKDWAKTMYDNVKTLISITKIGGFDLKTGANFALTMGLLGMGMLLFGIGKGANSLSNIVVAGSEKIGEHFNRFKEKGWAKTMYDNVKTLLEITKLPGFGFGKALTFVGVMATLGLGMAAFALGKTVNAAGDLAEAAGDAGAKAVKGFYEPFAQRIKDNVKILLTIPDLPNAKNEEHLVAFKKVMASLGLGLTAFAVGKSAAGVADKLAGGPAIFKKGGFAKQIKDEVTTLLSIGNIKDIDKVYTVTYALKNLGIGLAAFGAGEFVGTLAAAGTAVLTFLGAKGPIEKMKELAKHADPLTKGADALTKIVSALERISALKLSGLGGLGIKELAEDLLKSMPIIEKAVMGGTVEGGIFPWQDDDMTFKGLASPDIKFEEAANNITLLKKSFTNIGTESTQAESQAKTDHLWSKNLTRSIDELAANVTAINTGGNMISQTTHNRVEGSSSAVVNRVPQVPISAENYNAGPWGS